MHIGDRAVQASNFLEWGLRPRPVEPGSRRALDDAAIPFVDDEPNLISSTARYPAMNASENPGQNPSSSANSRNLAISNSATLTSRTQGE